MRRFLLLALCMGFLLPTAVNALSFRQKKAICADYEGGNISIEKAAKKLGVKKAYGGWVKSYCAYYKN